MSVTMWLIILALLGLSITMLGGAAGAYWSFLIWKIYQGDRPEAIGFRKRMDDWIQSGDELPDADTDIKQFHERMDQMVGHVNELTSSINGFPEEIQKMRQQLDGALGRAQQVESKEVEEFEKGLDLLADEQLMENLPFWLKPIAAGIMEKGNPKAMHMVRTWAVKRPDVRQLMGVNAGVPPENSNPQVNTGQSEWDRLYG